MAQLVASGALLAAAAVHVAAAQHHAGLQRAFFVVVVLGQAGLAVAVLRRPRGDTATIVALSCAALIGLWLESRTVGVGYGVEPVGAVDGTAKALELVALLASRWMCGARSRPTPLNGELAAWGLILVAGALAATA
ncbi:MAG: hypothetical protein JWO22_1394 [Frankiales bacterium]|nr:hypothetical protein [Frankiales bacterium]